MESEISCSEHIVGLQRAPLADYQRDVPRAPVIDIKLEPHLQHRSFQNKHLSPYGPDHLGPK